VVFNIQASRSLGHLVIIIAGPLLSAVVCR
jgi:hypothetical protein